ncbi:hypothetical protein BBJ28_00004848 [Nothophytophthora sp. Chile5]|nr:hypothetical protein BBJ28_00004848 [Nothophytophthora sp. Chile5]
MAARAAPKSSRAVETYLRNFEGEKARYQEILEITLCYGVQCLAQNFSLKGLSCNELRVITGKPLQPSHLQRRGHAFASPFCCIHLFLCLLLCDDNQPTTRQETRTPAELRAKPPHSWRDGEVELADFPDPSKAASERPRATSEHTEKSTGMLYSLPPAFDEIDFHTKMLGKPLVDLAWKTFTGRAGSQVTTRSELEEQFCRIDQRKTSVTIPAVELPISSFAEFLDSYVTECSKIQPELDARRQKLLRVKKTQSQRMAESLARARLGEYEARRELQDVRDRRLGPKKMPLNEITKGDRLALRHCSLDKDKKTDHDAHGDDDSFADDLSDGLSVNSDPAFQWLKDTV